MTDPVGEHTPVRTPRARCNSDLLLLLALSLVCVPPAGCASPGVADARVVAAERTARTQPDSRDFYSLHEGGVHTVGGPGTGFIASLEPTGLFETSGARAERHGGTVVVTEPYYIARESVTAGAFCAFLNETARSSPRDAAGFVVLSKMGNIARRGGVYAPREGESASPVNCASFSGASAFCAAFPVDEGFSPRLPTESEWIIAEDRFQFFVEHTARGEQLEGGNWTSDYYTDSLRTITSEADSRGPAESDRFGAWGAPSRVVRYPIEAVYDRRTWGFEGRGRGELGQGFRVVIAIDEPLRSLLRRMRSVDEGE